MDKRPLVREVVVSGGLLKRICAIVETSQGLVKLKVRAFREEKLWDKLYHRILAVEGWGSFIEIRSEIIQYRQ